MPHVCVCVALWDVPVHTDTPWNNQPAAYMCAYLATVHDVPAGLISIEVSFAGTQIYEEVDDLCSKTSCPIKTGPLDIKYIQDLPPIAPPVSVCCSWHMWGSTVAAGF